MTLGIDLSRDWTNSSLDFITTPRPVGSLAMNFQKLWWDEADNIVYCFGGERSFFAVSTRVPTESIWRFHPNGQGGGNWSEIVGPLGTKSFPPDIIRPAAGASAVNGAIRKAYYIGGFESSSTSPELGLPINITRAAPGLLTFSFDSLTLTNTSDGGYFASEYSQSFAARPGAMLNVSPFGINGVLIVIGGSGPVGTNVVPVFALFNNITVFDPFEQKWYSQTATWDVPEPRQDFCVVGIQGSDNSTYEM